MYVIERKKLVFVSETMQPFDIWCRFCISESGGLYKDMMTYEWSRVYISTQPHQTIMLQQVNDTHAWPVSQNKRGVILSNRFFFSELWTGKCWFLMSCLARHKTTTKICWEWWTDMTDWLPCRRLHFGFMSCLIFLKLFQMRSWSGHKQGHLVTKCSLINSLDLKVL